MAKYSKNEYRTKMVYTCHICGKTIKGSVSKIRCDCMPTAMVSSLDIICKKAVRKFLTPSFA